MEFLIEEEMPPKRKRPKNPNAVALGKLRAHTNEGRFQHLSKEERSDLARMGAKARWQQYPTHRKKSWQESARALVEETWGAQDKMHRLDHWPGKMRRGWNKYPWDKWCDGSVWEIQQDVDFFCQDNSMRAYLHTQAQKLQIKCRTIRPKPGTLIFQFYKEGESIKNVKSWIEARNQVPQERTRS